MKPKYRIRSFDIVNDIWVLEQRVLFLFWRCVGAGKRAEVEAMADRLNSELTPGPDVV